MNGTDELQVEMTRAPVTADARVQASVYLLELSPDWIVLRASENIHHLLHESHVTLVDESLSRFVHAQALHDLRNRFARLSGTMGVARAYGVRLTDDPTLVDVAFQLSETSVLFEAVASAGTFGEYFGSVGGLVAGLSTSSGQALLDNAARRMRALTGYDRVTLVWGNERAESSRGAFPAPARAGDELPVIVADACAEPVALFPRHDQDSSAAEALMRACAPSAGESLAKQGVRASVRVRFTAGGTSGEFRCDSRRPCDPSFELHAAAELFAQMFAMRLEIDRLKSARA